MSSEECEGVRRGFHARASLCAHANNFCYRAAKTEGETDTANRANFFTTLIRQRDNRGPRAIIPSNEGCREIYLKRKKEENRAIVLDVIMGREYSLGSLSKGKCIATEIESITCIGEVHQVPLRVLEHVLPQSETINYISRGP